MPDNTKKFLSITGNEHGRGFRDLDMEAKVLELTRKIGIGAQFGGKYFCHDVRVVRLPRHGASCPVGIGVSCSADRQVSDIHLTHFLPSTTLSGVAVLTIYCAVGFGRFLTKKRRCHFIINAKKTKINNRGVGSIKIYSTRK